MKYICVIALLCSMVSCTEVEEQPESNKLLTKAMHTIAKAEKLLEFQADKAMEVLDGMSEVDSLNAPLLLRWCIVYGQAANELRRNELLPQARFEHILEQDQLHSSLKDRAWLYFFLGNIRIEQKKEAQALELYTQAQILAENIEEYVLAGHASSALGWLYWAENKYEKAQAKYELAVKYYKLGNSILGQVRAMGNIAYVLIEQKETTKALEYATETEKIAQENRFALGISSGIMSKVHRQLGDYELSEEYGLRGVRLDTLNTAPHYTALSKTYLLQGKYDLAHWCLDKAETSPSLNRYTPRTIAMYRAQLAEAEGNAVRAGLYMAQYKVLRDSLALSATASQLLGAEARVSNLKQKNEFLSKEIKRRKTFFSGIIVLVLIASGVVWYIFRRQRSRELSNVLDDNHEYLQQLSAQEEMYEEIEQRTFRRLIRKGFMSSELLEQWEVEVEIEMRKMMHEKLNKLDQLDLKKDSAYN